MAIDKFIPSMWSAKLLLELRKNLVYGQENVINRDYEGEILQQGDAVKIHSFGAVSVFPYVKNADMQPPETLNDSEITLTIDGQDAFNFQIDDIDKAQQTPKILADVMADAAYRLADSADKYIAGMYKQAGQTVGTDAAPIALTVDNLYDTLVDMYAALAEKNAPAEGRWVIVPPWAYALLLKDKDRFIGAGAAGPIAQDTVYNGLIGRAAGFTILQSNNVPAVSGKYKILAGSSAAWSFASQISSVEAYRPEKRFGDAVKGLHLYGGKVTRPECLVCLTATRG